MSFELPVGAFIAHMSGAGTQAPDAFMASTNPVRVSGARGCSHFQSNSSSAPCARKFCANSSRVAIGERAFDSSMKPPTAILGEGMGCVKMGKGPILGESC